MRIPTTILALATLAVAAIGAPLAGAAIDECKLTGATDASGDPIAPPCVSTYPEDPTLRTVPDAVCATSVVCPKYYVLLVPDSDGNPDNGIQFTHVLLWRENNFCAGLQRGFEVGCGGKDVALVA